MMIFFILFGVLAVFYLYAAIAFYFGFRNWAPFCTGCSNTVCDLPKHA